MVSEPWLGRLAILFKRGLRCFLRHWLVLAHFRKAADAKAELAQIYALEHILWQVGAHGPQLREPVLGVVFALAFVVCAHHEPLFSVP